VESLLRASHNVAPLKVRGIIYSSEIWGDIKRTAIPANPHAVISGRWSWFYLSFFRALSSLSFSRRGTGRDSESKNPKGLDFSQAVPACHHQSYHAGRRFDGRRRGGQGRMPKAQTRRKTRSRPEACRDDMVISDVTPTLFWSGSEKGCSHAERGNEMKVIASVYREACPPKRAPWDRRAIYPNMDSLLRRPVKKRRDSPQ
jgi:hypothetical protein